MPREVEVLAAACELHCLTAAFVKAVEKGGNPWKLSLLAQELKSELERSGRVFFEGTAEGYANEIDPGTRGIGRTVKRS